MRYIHPWLVLLLVMAHMHMLSFTPQQQAGGDIEISDPLPGNAVQGLVQIIGTININELDLFRLEFTSQKNQSQTWFLISENDSTIINNIIGEWDTSILTDGNYDLRLTVLRQSGESNIELIEGIRVRNYSPIETDTPSPTTNIIIPTATIEIAPTITPTAIRIPSPTPSRPNPAGVDQGSIAHAVLVGGIIGSAGVLIIALYINIRRNQ